MTEKNIGGTTAAAIAVHEHGAGSPLAGPGTGRAISQPTDARTERVASYDPADFPVPEGREEEWRFTPLRRLRGLVQIEEGAHGSKSTVKCDALLVDTVSRSDTYPYVDVREDDVSMGHEATVSKVSEDQLFYLMSRGLSEDEAMAMIVRGFVEPIARELPMEYALELNRLIELQMEGAVG